MPAIERLTAALADRYRIERELGQGGMATVYLAEDLRHNRKVAIKVLREDLAASLGSGRFLREIQIAAQLQHPNILPLLDSGDTDGFLHYVMPFVSGQSLRERLAREGELPVHEAIRLLVEVSDALAEAHRHGVVHRDIKPDNVMLSGRHALVADFGVAKAISEATGRNTITTLGVAVGTPAYMSPEQAAADPHIDHRSDIYAVGVMAYEMLSGRPPFVGATPQQVLAAHVTEAPESVAKRRTAIPPMLEQIVMRCLAKRPADRFQTSEELLQQLEALTTPTLGVTPTQTQPVSGWQAPVTSRRWLLPVAGLALLVIAVAAWLLTRAPATMAVVNPPRVQATFTGAVEVASLSPDGERLAYGERVCGADFVCTYDLVIQDIGGAGRLRVASGLQGLYAVEWSGDSRAILLVATTKVQFGLFMVSTLGGAPPRFIGNHNARFLGGSDSIMISSQPEQGKMTFTATGALDPRGGGSWTLTRRGIDVNGWAPSPDGRLVAINIRSNDGTRNFLLLVNRLGAPLDSIEVVAAVGGGWRDNNHLTIATEDSMSAGSMTVVEHALTASGQFTGRHRIIIASQPMQRVDVSAGGLTYLAGMVRSSAYAVARRNLADTTFAIRELTGSTAGLGQLISGDGQSFIVARRTPGPAAQAVTQFSLHPFDGGPERSLAAGIRGVIAHSRTVTADALVVVHREGARARVTQIDLASGRVTDHPELADTTRFRGLEVMRDGSIAWGPDDSLTTLLITEPSRAIRRVQLPGFGVSLLEDSHLGFGMAGWGYSEPAGDSLAIFHVAPGATTARVVVRFMAEYVAGMHWLPDGNLEIGLAESAATVALYIVNMTTGAMRRVATIPINFVVGLSFSLDGLRMGPRVQEPRFDAWVARW